MGTLAEWFALAVFIVAMVLFFFLTVAPELEEWLRRRAHRRRR